MGEAADVTTWTVQFVQLALVAVVSFLARNAFTKVESTLEGLGKKLDSLAVELAKADGDRRVVERDLAALAARVDRLERELSDLSEGVVK